MSAQQPLREAIGEHAVLLDGGLATQLEAQGHDLSDGLWSARLLRDAPDAIAAAHEAYFAAGAQVAITASYQATRQGVVSAGGTAEDADALVVVSVELARRAAATAAQQSAEPTPRWVAGSVGPYGAMLAHGQEYTGDYDLSVKELRAFHRPRMKLLRDAGADVLALETIPQLTEVTALVEEVEDLGIDAWLSVTVSGDRLRSGEPLPSVFELASSAPHVIAVGVNCSAPDDATRLVAPAAQASGKPVVIYPNSGETWDGQGRCWIGTPGLAGVDVHRWVADGARLVGGCCRVGPADIATLAADLVRLSR